jgi:hypothetical protein
MPLALGILALYLQRLLLHHIPAKELIVSSFLPLGPCGLAGFSLVKLGKAATVILPAAASANGSRADQSALVALGMGMFGGGCVGALLLWGLGVS